MRGPDRSDRDIYITSVTYFNAQKPNSVVYKAVNCTIVVNHTVIQCLTAPGVGTGHTWVVEIGYQATKPLYTAQTTSYAPPIILDDDTKSKMPTTCVYQSCCCCCRCCVPPHPEPCH